MDVFGLAEKLRAPIARHIVSTRAWRRDGRLLSKKPHNRITRHQAQAIKGYLYGTKKTHAEIANILGVKKHTVSDISAGRTWRQV